MIESDLNFLHLKICFNGTSSVVTEFGEQISAEFVTEFGASPNSSLNSVQKSAFFPSPVDIRHIPQIFLEFSFVPSFLC